FQAEDGIRDLIVTGVQTCALPIFRRPPQLLGASRDDPRPGADLLADLQCGECDSAADAPDEYVLAGADLRARYDHSPRRQCGERSEERRVGKECRARGWRGDERYR